MKKKSYIAFLAIAATYNTPFLLRPISTNGYAISNLQRIIGFLVYCVFFFLRKTATNS